MHPSSKRRQKQRLTAGADGWTHVHTGPLPSSSSYHQLVGVLRPAEIPAACTVEILTPLFERASRDWHASSAAAELVRVLSKTAVAPPLATIDTVVCLGLGSVVDPRSRRCSMLQLAVLHSLIQLVQETHPLQAVLAQDPVFNHLDRAFLLSLGITVLDHPAALSSITPTALVYAPHAERSFMLPALKGTAPAVLVSNSFERMLSGSISTLLLAEERELATHFLSRYHSNPFPPYTPLDAAFNDVHVYCRKENLEEGRETGEKEVLSVANP
ncbi:MAG: hypothetical protein M1829_005847 [Trizodia sp. TS-e1964]|nr:MAG: hypothetical protein M1829_005847 [Trizodia sp. TS-e1964]